jgi:uncharacterized repeat protein (TIGR01451 family)
MNTGSVPGFGKMVVAVHRSPSCSERTDRARGLGADSPGPLCHHAMRGATRRASRVGLLLALVLVSALVATAGARTCAAAVRPQADLVVTMIATPLNVPVAGRIAYRISVTNQGPDLAAGVVVVDPIPAGLEFVSATTTQGDCAVSQRTLLCNLGSLVVGQNVVVELVVAATVAGQFRNGATVHSESPDPDLNNNTAFYPASAGPQPPPPPDEGPCVIDQTRAVKVTRGMLSFNPATRRFLQQVQIGNIAKLPITGPVWLVLDGLAPVVLTNADGLTTCRAPLGSPYIQINVGVDGVLKPQEVVTMTLSFAIPANRGLTYRTRLLTGTGER